MALSFTRVAERIALINIKQQLINICGIDAKDIYLNSPYSQYVNNRRFAEVGISEETRYPNVAVYPVHNHDVSPMGGYEQQWVTVGEQVKVYQSDYESECTFEFVVSTNTVKDFMEYKQALQLFFRELVCGIELESDELPLKAGMSIVMKDSKDDTANDIRTTIFTVYCIYKIYKEFLTYLFVNYELYMKAIIEDETISQTIVFDQLILQWASSRI